MMQPLTLLTGVVAIGDGHRTGSRVTPVHGREEREQLSHLPGAIPQRSQAGGVCRGGKHRGHQEWKCDQV